MWRDRITHRFPVQYMYDLEGCVRGYREGVRIAEFRATNVSLAFVRRSRERSDETRSRRQRPASLRTRLTGDVCKFLQCDV